MEAKDVRQQKIDFNDFDAVILTSRNSVDHFFRLAEEMRFKVPDSMRYFCQSEAVAYYLQKYVVYRKRKIYVGERSVMDLEPTFKKFKDDRYLFPSSDILKPTIPNFLDELGINWKRAQLYKTVVSDLSDLRDVYYDILVFLVLQESILCFRIFQILSKMTPALRFMETRLLTRQTKPSFVLISKRLQKTLPL